MPGPRYPRHYTMILIYEQFSVFTCIISRKGSNLTSWLLLIAIISCIATIRSSYIHSKHKIIMKADNCSAKINRHLVLLGIHENFPTKCWIEPICENFPP